MKKSLLLWLAINGVDVRPPPKGEEETRRAHIQKRTKRTTTEQTGAGTKRAVR